MCSRPYFSFKTLGCVFEKQVSSPVAIRTATWQFFLTMYPPITAIPSPKTVRVGNDTSWQRGGGKCHATIVGFNIAFGPLINA